MTHHDKKEKIILEGNPEVDLELKKAEENQRKQAEETAKLIQQDKDRSRMIQIKSRIRQQFQSPNSPYRGVVTSPEEQRMIEDQAKLQLRKEKKALIEHERGVQG